MKETMKKFLKHRSLQFFAALGIMVTSALASACTTVVRDKEGNVVTIVDHTETYSDAALKWGDLFLNKAPRSAAHLAREVGPIISAAGGIYETKRRWDAQEDWHDVIRENNAQYYSLEKAKLKPQPKPHSGSKSGRRSVPNSATGNNKTTVIRNVRVIQYQ